MKADPTTETRSMCRSSVDKARRKESQAERRALARSLEEKGAGLSRKRTNVDGCKRTG